MGIPKRQKMWERARKQALKRDHHLCRVLGCKIPKDRVAPHHIIPRDNGGGDSLPNLITLCETHHNMVEPLWRLYSTPCLIENLVYVGTDDETRCLGAVGEVTWQMVVYGGYGRSDLEPLNQKWREAQDWYSDGGRGAQNGV